MNKRNEVNMKQAKIKYNYEIIEIIQYLVELQTRCYNKSTSHIKNYDDKEKIYMMFADLIHEIGKYK
tara:strand:+ start:18 stop:218 length:201 start_codon:yes stop_codon:yes gene_type:complete